jgi:hypothetical protein
MRTPDLGTCRLIFSQRGARPNLTRHCRHAFHVALNYAYRHDPDRAFQWLDRAYRQKDPAMVDFLSERTFDNLANDPRYKAFLRKMNLPES